MQPLNSQQKKFVRTNWSAWRRPEDWMLSIAINKIYGENFFRIWNIAAGIISISQHSNISGKLVITEWHTAIVLVVLQTCFQWVDDAVCNFNHVFCLNAEFTMYDLMRLPPTPSPQPQRFFPSAFNAQLNFRFWYGIFVWCIKAKHSMYRWYRHRINTSCVLYIFGKAYTSFAWVDDR